MRKYAVQRVRGDTSQLVVASTLGSRQGFVSKWWNEFRKNGTWESLKTRSSRPKTIWTKKDNYIEPVLQLRKEHSKLGAQKIKAVLKIDLGHQSITGGSRIGRCWPLCSEEVKGFREKALQLALADRFQGVQEGRSIMLTFIDDHSHFVLASSVIDDASGYQVLRILDKAIALFGKPRQILTDLGAKFYIVRGGTREFDTRCKRAQDKAHNGSGQKAYN